MEKTYRSWWRPCHEGLRTLYKEAIRVALWSAGDHGSNIVCPSQLKPRKMVTPYIICIFIPKPRLSFFSNIFLLIEFGPRGSSMWRNSRGWGRKRGSADRIGSRPSSARKGGRRQQNRSVSSFSWWRLLLRRKSLVVTEILQRNLRPWW